ncbi:hypothetical protein SAMN04489724_3320 [Algoriphagus locisalis]|uniref:Uncharacterized protein n=1 Tax=Algoriphagus locisalis TaxID=305507 RepID=A0A1I7CQF4_9BACT|nr:hypothetical protein [Algoriphagus locisalis]SFU01701.1 hypothetical protein SAMN04489724_3320 [Algoriphagus locisalis]
MRHLEEYPNWSSKKINEIELAEAKSKPNTAWVFGIVTGVLIILIVLDITNDLLSTKYPVNGIVVGYTFSEGRPAGSPLLFFDHPSLESGSTNGIADAYEVSSRLESGEVVSFLCFTCTESSYTTGDSISILVSERKIGGIIYSENK